MSIESINLTPDDLFNMFRNTKKDVSYCKELVNNFSLVTDKNAFFNQTIQFIRDEPDDRVRCWGIDILELIGGDNAFDFLYDLLDKEDKKKEFRNTRFFALRSTKHLAVSKDQQTRLNGLLKQIYQDQAEDYLVLAESMVILAIQGEKKQEETVKNWLNERVDFWKPLRALRALNEFHLPQVRDEVLSILGSKYTDHIMSNKYLDHKYWAIVVLGNYSDDLKVVRELGSISVTEPNPYLRLGAVKSLARLKNRHALPDLLYSLRDKDAEIRVQASCAIMQIISRDEAVFCIVEESLKKETTEEARTFLIDALRRIDDPDRKVSTEILSKSLSGEDRERTKIARDMLANLGGWAAIQRVTQRRITLTDLDRLLTESENIVKDTFEDTIRQARRNFYFAMSVNIIIVIIGIALILIAIGQLIKDPDTLYAWVIPGTSGFFGVAITMNFNNPRKNAREDLATLMNVNVIFLGFLRQLNEVDATFKHAYLENPEFGGAEMEVAIKQIKLAMEQTLNMASRHLSNLQPSADGNSFLANNSENKLEK